MRRMVSSGTPGMNAMNGTVIGGNGKARHAVVDGNSGARDIRMNSALTPASARGSGTGPGG